MRSTRGAPRAARRHALPRVAATLGLLAGLTAGGVARAQTAGQDASTSPAHTASPRLSAGGEITVTVGPRDPDYFNFTDYYQNALRLTVVSANVAYAATSWLDLVGEVRAENADRVRLSAAYGRLRPRGATRVAVLAGRVPPVFGLFSRTRYGSDNPLVSRPLAYQYLTTLRYDAVAPSLDALLAVRGEGWLVRYPERPSGAYPRYGGATSTPSSRYPPAAGVPLVSTSRWDTGVVAAVTAARVEVSGGLTAGSLSDPRVDDNNGRWQLVGRAQWQPHPSWTFGASGARGAFLSDAAARGAGGADRSWPQSAAGLDLSFAAGHLVVRTETVVSGWRVPIGGTGPSGTWLSARGTTLELRYRVHPRLDVAARVDRLDFSPVHGADGAVASLPWDAEVTRLEAGLGYRLARRWRLKLAYQHDWREGATRDTRGFPAAQLAVWF